jgi:hypothetical protein
MTYAQKSAPGAPNISVGCKLRAKLERAKSGLHDFQEAHHPHPEYRCLRTLRLLDHLADAIFGAAYRPVASMTAFISTWLLNGYVGCLILGALIVGFWSNISALIKTYRSIPLLLLLPLLLAIGLELFGNYLDTMNDPKGFVPSKLDMQDAKGQRRTFSSLTFNQMREIVDKNTDIGARRLLQAESSKWTPIQGLIDSAVSDQYDDRVEVILEKHKGLVYLDFPLKDEQALAAFPKGANIRAICKLLSISFNEFHFNECELARS